MEETLKIVSNLEKYFDAKIVGSYLFVKAGLLPIDDINDIDVMIQKDKLDNAYAYMEDLGYVQTVKQGKQIGYENGRAIWEKLYQGDFHKEGNMSIDIIPSSGSIYTINELISMKIIRGKKSDLEQVLTVVDSKLKKLNV